MKRTTTVTVKLCAMVTAILVGVSTAQGLVWAAKAEGEQDLVTIAGSPGNGYADGMGTAARLASPMGLDVKDGSVVVADTENNLIRTLNGGRLVTTAGVGVGRAVLSKNFEEVGIWLEGS